MGSSCPAPLLQELSCHAQEGRNKAVNLVLPGTTSLVTYHFPPESLGEGKYK